MEENEPTRLPETGDSDGQESPPIDSVLGRRTYDFEDLSGGEPVINIIFQGNCYELKRTRSGRLVLHK